MAAIESSGFGRAVLPFSSEADSGNADTASEPIDTALPIAGHEANNRCPEVKEQHQQGKDVAFVEHDLLATSIRYLGAATGLAARQI
jgi:hypothetical protein